ncbi:MAG: UDP-N-acetylmuramoyl-L-alanine--D-glutamate ligase [Salinivirgaceae bacterium]|jgi:UDP-N-acetylmuramoylalanine--D-glutamate ligase|nr:UDP-N-acetylmuramoyl-L-alanine--D-glutamate ligase [Bacteroidales bacterium]
MQKRYNIVVLGGGESGVGAALLAKRNGESVFISDFGTLKDKYKKEIIEAGIDFEEGKHSVEIITNAKTIIKSPGIPDESEIVVQAKKSGAEIIGEIEYGARNTNAKFIAITGSNGKTTTTLLIYHILKQAGLKVGLAGNVGQSLARQIVTEDPDWFVVELSSFQLDTMFTFHAHIAILMNITPDHLDRYNYNFDNYINSKFRILQNQNQSDYFIYFADDPVVEKKMSELNIVAKKLTFSLKDDTKSNAYISKNQIIIKYNNQFAMFYDKLIIKGKHNLCNAMAASLVADITNIKNEKIRESLASFTGVEHRLEEYLTIHGVLYINDSKATNINSTWYALESMTKPTVWIVGGVDKGNDYSELNDVVAKTVKAIVCLGTDNKKIVDHFKDRVNIIVETQSMKEAVYAAYKLAEPNDVVLLSPACASFDLFSNYEERGKKFKDAVRDL